MNKHSYKYNHPHTPQKKPKEQKKTKKKPCQQTKKEQKQAHLEHPKEKTMTQALFTIVNYTPTPHTTQIKSNTLKIKYQKTNSTNYTADPAQQ